MPDDIRDWYEIDENFLKDLITKAGNKIKANADARKKYRETNPGGNITKSQHMKQIIDAGGDPSHMRNSYEPQGDVISEKPGDGYIGPTGIPNPIRMAKDAVDSYNRANLKKVNTVNKIDPGSASMPKFKMFNKDTSAAYKNLFQSYEPQGEVISEKDKKGKGSGKKDACYHKVKASASVWPSAYASGRLVQCRKVGAANYGKSKSKKEETLLTQVEQEALKLFNEKTN